MQRTTSCMHATRNTSECIPCFADATERVCRSPKPVNGALRILAQFLRIFRQGFLETFNVLTFVFALIRAAANIRLSWRFLSCL